MFASERCTHSVAKHAGLPAQATSVALCPESGAPYTSTTFHLIKDAASARWVAGNNTWSFGSMQFYDLVMLAVMCGAIFFGFWKGFAWQVASLAAIFASYFVARNFNQPVANMIGGDPAWNRFLAMFILFMGTSLLIWLGFGFVKSSIEKMNLKGFDRQVGAGLGAVKGVILCTLITLFSVSLLGETTCRSVCTSRSGNYIARLLAKMEGLVPPEIGQYIGPHIDKFQNEYDEHQNGLPPEQQNPPIQQPPPGTNGGFLPNQPGNWNNPNMTQAGSGAPNERVGQLQPIQGWQQGTQQQQQPVYNGTTGRWEYPNRTAQPQQQAPQSNGNIGGFQIPNVNLPASWTEGVKDGVRGAVQEGVQSEFDKWRRAWGGDSGGNR